MKDKFSQVCEYILDQIETEALKPLDKLPAARELCGETNASFAIVQHAVSALEHEGVLSCISRRGTYVRENYQQRILNNHLVIFNNTLPWIDELKSLMSKYLPDIRLCRDFLGGMFELRTTNYLQQHRDDYMDLSELLEDVYPDWEEIFFKRPFAGFNNQDGSLFGIPFIFSSRVIYYNKLIFQQYGVKEPETNWTWSEFIEYVRTLRQHLPAKYVLNYCDDPHYWPNFLFRAGGKIIDIAPDGNRYFCMNTPESCRGLELIRELRHTLGLEHNYIPWDPNEFSSGNYAMALEPRETLCKIKRKNFTQYGIVPMPRIENGVNTMAQATDLICIRKECVNDELAKEFIRFMLSIEVQDFIGGEYYGIPIRKSSAFKSIDAEDPRDVLFLSEMNYMTTQYNLDSPELGEIIQSGVTQILASEQPVELEIDRLASAIHTVLAIKNKAKSNQRIIANEK